MPESSSTPSSRAVFLSYASQDADAARRLCDALRAAGVEVWFDQNELVGGDAWDQKIRGQIASCALFVPIISANTQARLEGYFRREWKQAASRTHDMADEKAFLLPVVIDDTRDADAKVPAEFKAVQWTRLRLAGSGAASPTGDEDPALAKFVARVPKLLSTGTTPPVAGVADPGRSTNVKAPGSTTPATVKPSRRWIAPVIGGLGLAAVAILASRPWQRAEPTPAAAAAPASSNPKVATLLAQVRPLLDKTDVVRAELDAAVALLEQAAALDPADPEVWAAWALIDCRYLTEWFDRSPVRLNQAQRHATQAIGLGPKSPAARLAQAKSMTMVTDDPATKKAAVALLEPLVAEPGDHGDALIWLAMLEWTVGHREQASAYLDRAAKNPTKAGRAHYMRAIWSLWTGQAGRSEDEIKLALAAEPAALFQLWKSYLLTIWRGDSAGAKEALSPIPAAMIVEDFPAAARYFTYLLARDYEGAVAAMRAVPRDYIESQALTGPTGYYIGYAFARQGKTEAAAIEWRGALELVERRLAARPNDRQLLNFRVLLLDALGRRAEAVAARRTVRELHGPSTDNWEEYWREVTLLPEDEAIDFLAELAKDVRVMTLAGSLRTDPFLDRLRGNPRFKALLAQIEADPRLSPSANPAANAKPAAEAPPESEAQKLAGQAMEVMYGPEGLTRERLEAADEYIRRALAADSLDPRVLAGAARVDAHWVFYQMDPSDARRQQATSRAARAKLLAPDDPSVQLAQAQVYLWVVGTPAMRDEAERILRKLVSVPQVANGAKLILGILLGGSGRLTEAAALYEDIGNWASAGWAYLDLGRPDDALRMANKQLAIRHDSNAVCQKIVAQLYGREDLPAAARAAQEFKAEDLLRDQPLLFALQVALAHRDGARTLELVSAFPRETVTTPAVAIPRRYFSAAAHALAGRTELAQEDWRASLATMQQLVTSRPGNAALILWRMVFHARLGDATAADADARLASSLNASLESTLVTRLLAEIALGRPERAIQLLVDADKNPATPWMQVHAYLRFWYEFDPIRADPRFQKILRDHLPPGAVPLEEAGAAPAVSGRR